MMKLNLLFIVMDLLTLLAYPLVFMYGKLRKSAKIKGSNVLANLLVPEPVDADR